MSKTPSERTDNDSDRRIAPAGSAASVGRIVWGVFFIISSVVNLMMPLPNPEFYRDFADLTFLPFYRWLLLNLALPNATMVSALVVVFEFVAGILLLSKRKTVRWGLIGTAAWILFVTPAMGWYTLFSPVLLIIPALLLRFDYDRSLLDLALKRKQET
jgi:hypothetical protein